MENNYIGFDLSTQKLKAIYMNDKLQQIYSAEVKFDVDLPKYKTSGGVKAGTEKNEYFVDPVMWIEALEHVLDRLVLTGANFLSVVGISGSAQQHGSVYWSQKGIDTLKNLDPDQFLRTQVNHDAFTIQKTPIWMDSTTTQQCREMEEAVGGKEEMVNITGSKCYERFTGSQIRKIYQKQPIRYEESRRISLVSSFLASLFLQEIAPIDYSDASGMNLLDIHQKSWSQKCLDACSPGLAEKLGEPVPSSTILGNIGQYFILRYNFNPNCKVVAFTGDNPSALAGMNVGNDWIAISLGTSDTIMMSLTEHPQFQEGHVLLHPTQDDFMGLLCFKNGSFVRDIFKKSEANDNWDLFTQLLENTPRGNNGYMALHYHAQEILPQVKGSLKWGPKSSKSRKESILFTTQHTEIRALIEGQMLNRKAFALEMGFNFGENTNILATGGSSSNHSILQVMSDVFNAPVYVQKTGSEAACSGGAYRAKYALYKENALQTGQPVENYYDYIKRFCGKLNQRVCEPHTDSQEIYIPMLLRYQEMVDVMRENQENEAEEDAQ